MTQLSPGLPAADGPIDPAATPSPTVTHYELVAAQLSAAVKAAFAQIGPIEAPHPSTRNFVHLLQTTPLVFIDTVTKAADGRQQVWSHSFVSEQRSQGRANVPGVIASQTGGTAKRRGAIASDAGQMENGPRLLSIEGSGIAIAMLRISICPIGISIEAEAIDIARGTDCDRSGTDLDRSGKRCRSACV